MTWVLIVGAAWLAVAAVVALTIGRAIHLADEKQRPAATPAVVEDDPHVRLRAIEDLPPTADGTVVPQPRAAATGRAERPRGRRFVVSNPVASSERAPHTRTSGAR